MSLSRTGTIEGEFAGLTPLRFSPPVEARFETEGLSERIRLAQATLFAAIFLYDIFLLADWMILPDVLGPLAVMRLGVFTPLTLLMIWILPRRTRTWQVDGLLVGGCFLSVLMPSTIISFSASHYVATYQLGSMLIIFYMVLVQRVRFRMAVIGMALIVLTQISTVARRPEVDAPTFWYIVVFYLIAAAIILLGSFVLERTERYGFLQRLRVESMIERNAEMARTDQLTGLFNRHHLATIGADLIPKRDTQSLGALLIDIDHFKRFNDTQGHLAGDRCIRTVSDLVREMLVPANENKPPVGTAVRFGGEEFLVLLPGMDAAQAAALGEAIRRRVEGVGIPHPGLGPNAVVTLSIGVADWKKGHTELDTLVNAADAALYQAKNLGRNRVAVA
ncbi:MAG: GGDEF domain-containing protein [Methylorubrum extorquens]|jgi:diguanylate cyclase (GGDEF)-like protein|uniref:diguanylate cyclase n=1 Tax=Methylorubrum extorquens (strain DSM 6343 / CIP 106787 / DM4) TaxID=661410 RepID=C7CH59_METED|nr:GGDEF domain-containing protein [Methylorubrum extorquens]CAX26359.1 putative diguanylate cyclase (GGDEF) [Methylorubrum extorquens DM4]